MIGTNDISLYKTCKKTFWPECEQLEMQKPSCWYLFRPPYKYPKNTDGELIVDGLKEAILNILTVYSESAKGVKFFGS